MSQGAERHCDHESVNGVLAATQAAGIAERLHCGEAVRLGGVLDPKPESIRLSRAVSVFPKAASTTVGADTRAGG
ncbi:hypothetical protein RKD22_005664 [Streptomyces pristinaespiralis]